MRKYRIGSVCLTTLKVEYGYLSACYKEVDGAENVTLNGKFLSEMYEGVSGRQKNGAGTLRVMRKVGKW